MWISLFVRLIKEGVGEGGKKKKRLPEGTRPKKLKMGLQGAYVFRKNTKKAYTFTKSCCGMHTVLELRALVLLQCVPECIGYLHVYRK